MRPHVAPALFRAGDSATSLQVVGEGWFRLAGRRFERECERWGGRCVAALGGGEEPEREVGCGFGKECCFVFVGF